jgi:anthranilate phosphoribosyltransferase
VVAERAADLREGAALAAEALDSGAAARKLEALVRLSNRDAQD